MKNTLTIIFTISLFLVIIPNLNGQVIDKYKILLNEDRSPFETKLVDGKIIYEFNFLTDTLSLFVENSEVKLKDLSIEIVYEKSNKVIFTSNNCKLEDNQVKINVVFSDFKKTLIETQKDNSIELYKIRFRNKNTTQDILVFEFKE